MAVFYNSYHHKKHTQTKPQLPHPFPLLRHHHHAVQQLQMIPKTAMSCEMIPKTAMSLEHCNHRRLQ